MEEKENNNMIKVFVIAGIMIFFGALFVFYLSTLGIFAEDTNANTVRNDRVIFEQPKLSIFDETRYINEFPDTIRIHYPYLIVVVPEDTKKITTVYSLEEKKEVATYNDIVLDYHNGNFLYNFHGGNTFFKGKDLGVHCDHGFIKGETEILCITAKTSDPQDNKLITIIPQTLAKKDLYSSQNALTAVYYDKSTLYVGEYDFTKGKAYLTINSKKTEVEYLINIFYPMQNKFYAASFKSAHNNRTESYSEIVRSKNAFETQLVKKGQITFY